MSVRFFGTEVCVTFPFAFLLALLLAADRTGMMSVSLIAAAVHETGHLAALYALKMPPKRIRLRLCGIQISHTQLYVGALSRSVVAAAGPATNFVLSVCLLPFSAPPFAAQLCAAGIVVGVFNLLPLSGLDGGDILRCLLDAVCKDETVYIISKAVDIAVSFMLLAVGIYIAAGPEQNPTMLIAAVYLAIYALALHR